MQADEIQAEANTKKHAANERVKRILETAKDFEDFATIIDEEWPSEYYKHTVMETSKEQAVETREDLAIFLSPNTEEKNKRLQAQIHRFPALKH